MNVIPILWVKKLRSGGAQPSIVGSCDEWQMCDAWVFRGLGLSLGGVSRLMMTGAAVVSSSSIPLQTGARLALAPEH